MQVDCMKRASNFKRSKTEASGKKENDNIPPTLVWS